MPRDEDDFNFKELLNLIKDLASKVVQSERGISLMAIALGLGMKSIPRSPRLTVGNVTIKTSDSPDPISNPAGYCEYLKANYPAVWAESCRWEIPPELAIDLFPINNIFGLPIPPDLGKVTISDFLILMGGLGVSGLSVETLSKLRGLIK